MSMKYLPGNMYPVNMPDPIRIGPEALARSGPNTSCLVLPGLLPDRIRLAQTRHSQPEPDWILAGFAQCGLSTQELNRV